MTGPATVALTIEQLNAMDVDAFVAALGPVYEASPALAAQAWWHRPFADRAAVVAAFHAVADGLDDGAQLALLRAHPQLGATGPMAADSVDEQRSVGLDVLDDDARGRIASSNARYLERFGFPFVIAVRGLQPADIAAALAERLDHDDVAERAEALDQVKRIAGLRLAALVTPETSPSGSAEGSGARGQHGLHRPGRGADGRGELDR